MADTEQKPGQPQVRGFTGNVAGYVGDNGARAGRAAPAWCISR